MNHDATLPRAVPPDYPAGLEAIVMRALARDPAKRFQTALELREALEDFAFSQGLHASPLRLARLMRKLFPPEPAARDDEHAEALALRYQSIGTRWGGSPGGTTK